MIIGNISMKTIRKFVVVGIVFVALVSTNTGLFARELADVNLSEKISVNGLNQELLLNGAGIRYKFFFKIYIGALYLTEMQTDASRIIKADHPNRVLMHFIYDEVEQQKLVSAWLDGFKANVGHDEFERLQERLTRFNEMFSDLHNGDVVLLDYLPEKGTRVTIKGEEKGVIAGADFNRALLSVWLGKDPVTDELKDAMLGIEEE